MDNEQEMKGGVIEFQKLRHWLVRSAQFAFILVVFGWGIYILQGLVFDNKKSPPVVVAAETWSAPEGYTLAETQEDIAYGHKWLAPDEYKCILFQRCIGVGIVTSKDCPDSLSIEADLLNKAGDKIGRTTGIVQLVTAKEKTRVLLTLDTAEAVSARITRAMCH